MDRHLIFGAEGLVGGQLLKTLSRHGKTVIDAPRSVDITNYLNVKYFVLGYKPSVIYLPAAWSYVDGCEKVPTKAFGINSFGVYNITSCFFGRLVFFSSDYVFDGRNGPYTVGHFTNPVNVYGKTKVLAEELLHSRENTLVVRTSAVYGFDKKRKNFVYQVLDAKEEFQSTTDRVSPTYVNDLVDRVLAHPHETGVIHVAGAEATTKLDFAKAIVKIWQVNKKITYKANTGAARPMFGGLVPTQGFECSDVSTGLQRFKEELG